MSDALTLDPPGSIAVVGAGPLGIEAALYGRFMGYDVTLIEATAVASRLRGREVEPLPMSPDRCLSPLAAGALQAQFPELVGQARPATIGQWISDYLERLVETDLLRGRLQCPARVAEISLIEVPEDEAADEERTREDAADDDVPPDFRLSIIDSTDTVDVEAVILAVGAAHQIVTKFDLPAPYLFRIGKSSTGDAEQDYWAGLKEIVGIFAGLAGRADLDLYRPRRH